jgi:KDO2-lipid IV(A) lauroyltransferase
MKNWKYLPVKWLLDGLAHLPLSCLYALSTVVYVILYDIIGYRRAVVRKNLVDSFPDKSEKEIKTIQRQFYRNFADYIVETIKLGHISDAEMMRRMEWEDLQVIDNLVAQGKSVVVYFSHCFNWEWATSMTLCVKYKANVDAVYAQVYRPLRNKWMDETMLKLRSRFHSRSFAKSHVLRDLIMLRRQNMPSVTGFMSDQKPSHGDVTHVVKFLNHPTAVITGTEQLARRLDMAVVYWDMIKLSRGHYKVVTRLITDDISSLPEFSVTDKYAQMLQETIERNPAIWLWSHKRWKNPVSFPSQTTEQ